jgi:integrase
VADATVDDLPGILRAYRTASKGPTMFNRTRAAVLAFLRDTVGRSHPLYGQIRDIQPRKESPRKPQPFTVAELVALSEKLGIYGPCAWAMAMTGMGAGEYWGRWVAKADRVLIYGTKRAGRHREIPLAGDLAASRGSAAAFAKAFKKALESPGRVPYDLRHTFATWLEEAGIPRTRRRLYLGHGAKDVTDLYERHEITRFLAEDSDRLRKLVDGKAPTTALKLA